MIISWLIDEFSGFSPSGNIVDDDKTYTKEWRSPQGDEYSKIGKLMIKNNITGCGEYHVKEIETNEYIIACSRDGENWSYYVAWPNLEKINLASLEMEKKLKPPY